MAYLRRLIHRAAVSRPGITQTASGVRKEALAAVSGMESVPCLLHPKPSKRITREFGADIQYEAIAMFKAGTDIRPKLGSTDGKNDRLVITDEDGATSSWLVVASLDSASARKLLVAFLKRSAT